MTELGLPPPALGVKVNVAATLALPATRSPAAMSKEIEVTLCDSVEWNKMKAIFKRARYFMTSALSLRSVGLDAGIAQFAANLKPTWIPHLEAAIGISSR